VSYLLAELVGEVDEEAAVALALVGGEGEDTGQVVAQVRVLLLHHQKQCKSDNASQKLHKRYGTVKSHGMRAGDMRALVGGSEGVILCMIGGLVMLIG
jgi:hypothetical protein